MTSIEPIEWEIVEEPWSEFLLDDNTRLYIRYVLQDVGYDVRSKEHFPLPNLRFLGNVLIRVRSPPELRQKVADKQEAPPNIRPSYGGDWEVIPIREQNSRPSRYKFYYGDYEIDFEIYVIPSVIVRSLSFKDPVGNPMYAVSWQPVARVSSLRKRNLG